MVHWKHVSVRRLWIFRYVVSRAGGTYTYRNLLGAFWLAFAATLTPFYNAEGAFTAGATTATETAAAVAGFEASLSMYSRLSVLLEANKISVFSTLRRRSRVHVPDLFYPNQCRVFHDLFVPRYCAIPPDWGILQSFPWSCCYG
jgi:hypothetical protein